MGRFAEGWKLRQREAGHAYAVYFSHGGTRYERSTGTSDPVEAAKEAARIYADVVQRVPEVKRPRSQRGKTLEELLAQWLRDASSTLAGRTCSVWETYARHFIDHFSAVDHVSEGGAGEYMRKRLKSVQADSVRHELTALRHFIAWANEVGALQREVKVPSVPKRTVGTRYEKRRRSSAVDLAPTEIERIIAELPEWSTSKKVARFPIRARFLVGYETSLRPTTLDELSVPENYSEGSPVISIMVEIDKNRWQRDVPLTDVARAALDRICPKKGLIFGKHDYREHIKAAGQAALPKARADKFTGTHLRSARITHWLEETGNLPGVQYLAGHKQTTTTARYVKPSLRAAEDVLRVSRPKKRQAAAQKRKPKKSA